MSQKKYNSTRGEQELSNHPGMRDALRLMAAFHMVTTSPDLEANIGLEDKGTKEVRTFHIRVEIKETTGDKKHEG